MSLVEITKDSRIVLKIVAALGILTFLIFLFVKGGTFFKNTFFPTPPAPPDKTFGLLPAINFPPSAITTTPKYRINTVSGSLPSFPDRIKVYALIQPQANITALRTAQGKVASLGYTQNQQAINPSVYKWSMPDKNNTLTYNILNFNFSVSSDYPVNPTYANNVAPDISTGQKGITEFVSALGANFSDIDFANATTTFYAMSADKLLRSPTPTSANFLRFDLFQNPVDKLTIFYPDPNNSLLNFTVTGSSAEVVESNYPHMTPDLTISSTYPLKTASQAYDELKKRNAYIASPVTSPLIEITDVGVGYYLNGDPDQKYLLPIIVFLGKNNFRAYVDGVSR